MLASVQEPLSKEDIVMVLQDNGLANYFEAASALSDLLSKKNCDVLPENPNLCIANNTTLDISRELDSTLPPSVRERAVNGALNLLARAKRERENKAVSYTHLDVYKRQAIRRLDAGRIELPQRQTRRHVSCSIHVGKRLVEQRLTIPFNLDIIKS